MKVVIFTLVIGMILLLGGESFLQADETEIIGDLEFAAVAYARVSEDTLIFGVWSNGCTNKEQLRLVVNRRAAGVEVALFRVVPDRCRAMPRVRMLTYTIPETMDAKEAIKFLNPMTDKMRRS